VHEIPKSDVAGFVSVSGRSRVKYEKSSSDLHNNLSTVNDDPSPAQGKEPTTNRYRYRANSRVRAITQGHER
jgi:hypothetical protein